MSHTVHREKGFSFYIYDIITLSKFMVNGVTVTRSNRIRPNQPGFCIRAPYVEFQTLETKMIELNGQDVWCVGESWQDCQWESKLAFESGHRTMLYQTVAWWRKQRRVEWVSILAQVNCCSIQSADAEVRLPIGINLFFKNTDNRLTLFFFVAGRIPGIFVLSDKPTRPNH